MQTRKVTTWFVAIGTTGLIAATLLAQDNRVPRREMNKPVITSMGATAGNGADGQLAACLIVPNQGEIALGKVAEQRAKDKDVKQFAEMMVKDHTDFMQKLEKFAENSGNRAEDRNDIRTGATAQPGAAPLTGVDRPAINERNQSNIAGAATQEMGGRALNFVALKQQIGEKCLAMTKRDLEQKEGAQFDKCYIGGQIVAHTEVLATLEVFREHASPELTAMLDKGIETTKSHLEQAQKIAAALDRESSK